MGIYDQPAVIDYILAATNSTKLHYVGFSQGTTSLMVMLSERPEYNDKIHFVSLMAPVGGVYYADSIYKLFTVAIPFFKVILSKWKSHKFFFDGFEKAHFNFSHSRSANFCQEMYS